MKFDTIKLSELAAIQTGPFGSQLHKEDYVVHGTPIVTVEHLGSRKFTEQNLPCVSDKDKERLKKYVLKTGDIVFSCKRQPPGHRLGEQRSRGHAQHVGHRLAHHHHGHDICIISFIGKTKQKFVRNIATGATMPSINTKFMGDSNKSPISDAQNKIASILWMIDDKIELNKKINKEFRATSSKFTAVCLLSTDKKVGAQGCCLT